MVAVSGSHVLETPGLRLLTDALGMFKEWDIFKGALFRI